MHGKRMLKIEKGVGQKDIPNIVKTSTPTLNLKKRFDYIPIMDIFVLYEEKIISQGYMFF